MNERNYATICESLSLAIGEIIMNCNEAGEEYDAWNCFVQNNDSLGLANLQNIEFTFDYSTERHEEIEKLEQKVRHCIFNNSAYLEKIAATVEA